MTARRRDAKPGVGYLAGALATLGLLAAAAALLTWTATNRAVDPARFSDVTVTALQSPAGRALLTQEVERQVRRAADRRGVTPPVEILDRVVPDAIDAVVASPQFEGLVTPTLRAAHTRLLDEPDRPFVVDLASLRDDLVAAAPEVQPYLPASDSLGTLSYAVADQAPTLARASRAADALELIPRAAGLAAVALIVPALLLARRRRRIARRIGFGLLLIAALCALLRVAGPAVAGDLAGVGQAEALATTVATEVLGGWWLAALAAGIPGALLAVRRVTPPVRKG